MARCPTCHRRLASGQACPADGGLAIDTQVNDPDEPPRWIRPISERVGSGGFASVWGIDETSVLKVSHADHELARARMAREAQALSSIGPPAVPRIDGAGVLGDGRAWIAMERISAPPLSDLLAEGPQRASIVIAIGTSLAKALARVHGSGFVHRDIKPDNIVRRTDGSIVILDLGLARKMPTDPKDPVRSGIQVGSLEYIAPEQISDSASVTARSDIYAVGVILYELAAGRPPFVGDVAALERAHSALRPPPLGSLVSVPQMLQAVVHDCLAKDPARRPQSADELAQRLIATRQDVTVAHSGHRPQSIGEGAQPVVLIWVELPRVDRALLGILQSRKVTIVSQRGRRVLGAVVGAEHPDPASAAIAAARDLAAAGGRVALHLDARRVLATGTGYTVEGGSEDWVPKETWTGVILSRAIATVTQTSTRAVERSGASDRAALPQAVRSTIERSGASDRAALPQAVRSTIERFDASDWVALADGEHDKPLFGRDALLADLAADAAAAFELRAPALDVIVGDHGAGKTAFAHAIAARIAELGVRVHVATVPPPGSGKPGASVLAPLIGTPQGPIVRAVGDALRAAARERPTAVILDDLHLADHDLLDALEYATLGGESLPLWVIAIASPRFDTRRPNYGDRADRHRRDVLAPLDEDAAVAMTAALLHPVEYPPLRALRHLAGLARGNPMHLATLAKEIRQRGAIRTRPNGEYFLDTTALDSLPPLALGPWLAARELSSLGSELVSLARVCAVLGDEFDRDELHAVVAATEAGGGATTTIDVDVGMRELMAAGILVDAGGRWRFRTTLLEEGTYATTNDAERLAIHRACLAYWCGAADELHIVERVARHAEAAGERILAATAFATIAEHAHKAHRALDADQAWQGALRNLDSRDTARSRALLGRARERYRLQRIREAIADLDEARVIAVEAGDVALELEILLEQATALDWADDYDGSAAVVDEVTARLATHPVPALDAELALARGRTLHRKKENLEASTMLRRAMRVARAHDKPDTEIVAGVLLAPALVEVEALEPARVVFDELISLCAARDDRFHLAACYVNRAFLWSARGEVEKTAADLRIVIQICREIGQATLERIGTYNLAEDLLWEGKLDEALALARRCLAIQRGHGESAALWDDLLVARILAAKSDVHELPEILDRLERAELNDWDRAMVRVLRFVVTGASSTVWDEVLQQNAAVLPVERQVELAHLAIQRGMLSADARAEVRVLATRHAIWSRRLDDL